MSVEDKLTSPSLQWRAGSTATLWFTGSVVKLFYALGARVNAHGLDRFLRILDERADIEGRQRGLLTGKRKMRVRRSKDLFQNSFESCFSVCVIYR
jgi:hypothetical protein